MNALRRTYRILAGRQSSGERRDGEEQRGAGAPVDVPPTTIRTKLAMFAVTFLSALVGTAILQAYRRGRRRLRAC